MLKSKRTLIFFLALLLFYTRFVNLSWGLPYPLHPDERNMANAIQDLNNLHFFAYGQFPLYLGYGGVQIFKFFDGDLGTPIGFQEAVISLRILSALASVLTAIIVVRLVGLFFHPNFKHSPFFVLLSPFFILIFSPALIQFSHFGTTESLLMFFYTAVVYVSLLYLKNRISNKKFILASSLLVGLAIGTKISSVIFLLLPLIILLWQAKTHRGGAYGLVGLLILTTAISVIVSPQNIISFDEFANSIRYESDVALGSRQVFYTRQFSDAIPIVFQFAKIFPYALGWPVFLAFLVGFFVLPYSRIYNFLRLAFLLYFLPNAFLYAKWTRFMAPVLPLMIVLASLALVSVCHPRLVWTSDMLSGSAKCHSGLSRICRFWMRFFQSLTRMTISRFRNKFGMTLRKLVFYPLLFASVVPGIAFLSIYTNPDVRLAASEWIYKNIPKNSYILSETANVVDLPLNNITIKQYNKYRIIPFNFYDLDQDAKSQQELSEHLTNADYIIVPSRRVFANHGCEKVQNSKICQYYRKLFNGELGFKKEAEFSSYPKIVLSGKTLIEFPDEEAEETWTVFDHPVVRIYKRK